MTKHLGVLACLICYNNYLSYTEWLSKWMWAHIKYFIKTAKITVHVQEAELNIHTLDFSFNKLKTINAKNIPDKIQVSSSLKSLLLFTLPWSIPASHKEIILKSLK